MASRRRSRVPNHGLGEHDREYEYVRQQLLDLDEADQAIVHAFSDLRTAVQGESRGKAFDAKQRAQTVSARANDVLKSAALTSSLGKLDRLPRYGVFMKAHDLMREFRRTLEHVDTERRALAKAAWGTLEHMREQLSARSSRDRSRRVSRSTQRQISDKIRVLRHEGYPQRQAVAIAYRMHGVSRHARDQR